MFYKFQSQFYDDNFRNGGRNAKKQRERIIIMRETSFGRKINTWEETVILGMWQILLTLICQLSISDHDSSSLAVRATYWSSGEKNVWYTESKARSGIGCRPWNMQSMLTHWLIWDCLGAAYFFFFPTNSKRGKPRMPFHVSMSKFEGYAYWWGVWIHGSQYQFC